MTWAIRKDWTDLPGQPWSPRPWWDGRRYVFSVAHAKAFPDRESAHKELAYAQWHSYVDVLPVDLTVEHWHQ